MGQGKRVREGERERERERERKRRCCKKLGVSRRGVETKKKKGEGERSAGLVVDKVRGITK